MDTNDLIGILVEQNKSFIEQNKNYKDMLVFAVGSILTILVIFLTANFFTMRKFREDELEKLQTAVLQNIQLHSLPELKKDFDEKLNLLVEEKFSLLEAKIEQLDRKVKLLDNQLDNQKQDFNKQVFESQGNFHLLKAELHFEKKSYNNAFDSYLRAGKCYLAADTGWSLGSISRIMKSLETSAENLNYTLNEVSDFSKFASKLDSEYQVQAKKISGILASVKNI